MTVDYITPLGLPSDACQHIRQQRQWLKTPAVGFELGALTCAKHGIALGDEAEQCKHRANGPCWHEERLEAGLN